MFICSRRRQARSAIALNSLAPRKSLGQHFLVNQTIAQRIVRAAQINSDDLVVEIGPGIGALTVGLAQRARRVIAVELDRSLIPVLKAKLGEAANVTIVHGDALEVDFSALVAREVGPFAAVRFVANLPYYITSAAIRRILECGLPSAVIVLTVQAEVAERIVAHPPDMSLLAVSVQFYGRPELLFRIPAGCFYPPPKVESAVVRIYPHTHWPSIDAASFFQVVRAGFCQPRKQLRNALAAGLNLEKSQITAWLGRAGIDPAQRPETLSVEDWIRLCERFAG
jgi:16S rRNA (adenine1518-N6/adenine1519-N6)-dimethyltransferase